MKMIHRSKVRAEKLERIVTNYDEKQNLTLQLAQASRWLPGYGYCAWVITTKEIKMVSLSISRTKRPL